MQQRKKIENNYKSKNLSYLDLLKIIPITGRT